MKERSIIMTIDEAINHCEKVASGHERNCEIFTNDSELWQINKEWADNYRHIAEWLRELKAYREDTRFADLYERICIKRDDDREYFARTKDKTYITRIAEKEMFIHMMQDMMFDRYGVEEVNADADSD